MGSSVVPAQQPAGSENWQVISSVTASGSTVSFTSISGYRKLKIVGKPTTSSSLATLLLRFNSDSGSNYSYVYDRSTGAASILYVTSRGTEIDLGTLGGSFAASMTVSNVNTTGVKTIEGYSTATGSGTTYVNEFPQGDYETSSAITSVQVITSSTFSGGNITLYGVAL